MEVFISWSGERSRKVGELLKVWIRNVMQHVRPWFSADIARGSVWFNELSNALQNTKAGIICITKENRDAPWILFKAGAISRGLGSNLVCTLLIDCSLDDLDPPLSQFNATQPTEQGMMNLVRTLNAASGEKQLPQDLLETAFTLSRACSLHGGVQPLAICRKIR